MTFSTRICPPSSPSGRHRFTAQLDAEWERLRYDRRSTRQARGWALRHEVRDDPAVAALLADASDLGRVLGATHRGTGGATEGAQHDDHSGTANRTMCCLVELAATDQLAGRMLVQRLLPALLARAGKLRFRCGNDDPAEIAVPALWIAIHQYDTVRRPTHVAAALVADAIHLAFRKEARRRSADERSVEPTSFEAKLATPSNHSFVELAGVVRDARDAGVPGHHLDLIRQLLRTESPSIAARECGITPRALRNRRDRAVDSIRSAIDPAPLVAA